MSAVSVTPQSGSLAVSKPVVLFPTGGEAHLVEVFDATPDGQHLPLSQFADVKVNKGASFIYRESNSRFIGIQFDVEGRCLDQPCEPQGGTRKDRIRQPWYPIQELYGLVFAYMGGPAKKPVLPRWDALQDLAPDEKIFATDSSFSVGGDDSIKIFALSNVGDHGDHVIGVVFLEPGNNDGGVESSGISKHNFLRHEFSLISSGPRQWALA